MKEIISKNGRLENKPTRQKPAAVGSVIETLEQENLRCCYGLGRLGLAAKLSYTSAEAAEALGISVRSLRRLEIRGLIRCSKALGKKLYPLTEIQRFLEETL